MEHAAGMDVLVNGDYGDDILGAEVPERLRGGYSSRAGADDYKSLHGHTSLTSIAFLGQTRTQAGPSSRWAQKSHLTTRFLSGVMAGTP